LNEKPLGGKDRDSKTFNVGGLRNDSGNMILITGDATRGGGLARLPVNSSTAPRTGTLLAAYKRVPQIIPLFYFSTKRQV
jgi:hypothetical protein